MAGFTEYFKEKAALGAPIFPNTNGVAQQNTGTVNMALYARVAFIIAVGTQGANGTITAALQQGNQAGGGDAADITGCIMTINSQAYQQDTIELQYGATELTGQYVRGRITTGVNAPAACGLILGLQPRYQPVTQDASVLQQIAG